MGGIDVCGIGRGAQGSVAEGVEVGTRRRPGGVGMRGQDGREGGWVEEKNSLGFVDGLSEILGMWGMI